MRKKSLLTRFVVASCLLLGFMAACGGWSILTFERLGAARGEVFEENQEAIDIAVEIIYALEAEDAARLAALAREQAPSAGSIETARAEFERLYRRLGSHLKGTVDAEAYAALRKDADVYRATSDRIASTRDLEGLDQYTTDAKPLLRQAVADVRHFRESNVKSMRLAGEEIKRDARRAGVVVGGLTVLAFSLSVAVVGLLTRSVLRPVGELNRGVEEIRLDNLAYRVPVLASDELGRLAEGFNRMAEALDRSRREAEDRFRQLAENIHEIFWITTASGDRFLYVSPGFEDLWGSSRESLYDDARSWLASVHRDDLAAVEANVDARLRGEFGDIEFRVARSDGSVRWIRNRAFALESLGDQKPRVGGLMEDITARRQAEERIRESEARFRTFADHASDAFFLHDEDLVVRDVNRQACDSLGYSREELLGMTPLDLDPDVTPDSLKAIQAKLKEGQVVAFESRHRRRDGSTFPVEIRGQSFRERGRTFTVALARDVTERKRTVEALHMAKESAESANRAKDEFLANVSHEIRTPMNAILGMTELVLDTPLSEDQRQSLRTVKSAADSLLVIINDLLDFSKIEAGRMELYSESFSLRTTLGDTVRALAVRAHRKGLELVSSVEPGVPDSLVGDAGRLRQVILNLVGNAIKFTETGEVVVRVECDGQAPFDGRVALRFSVRDTGIGIPPDKHDAIFRAFEQEDSSTTRRYGGTGLGLTIAGRIVDLMGGKISVESEPGRGSVFSFRAVFEANPTAEPSAPPTMTASLEGVRALVVDDNASNRHILTEYLRNWRLNATSVDSGVAALDALRDAAEARQNYDLVLLDARMPDADGLLVAEMIRRRPELSSARVLLLTSGDRPSDVSRYRELKIDAHLLKPVQQDELLAAIYRVMEGTASRTVGAATDEESSVAPAASWPAVRRVLAAEDNEFNAQVLELFLTRLGCDVQIARDGIQALALLNEEEFDLALLDVHMPGMDGFEVARRIREREATTGGRIPIIALTARSRNEDRNLCLAAGMDDFLAKPLRSDDLSAALRRIAEEAGEVRCASHAASTRTLEPAVLLAACDENEEILQRIAAAFAEHLPAQLAAMHDAVRREDAAALREASHKLAGILSAFSSKAASAASELEDMASAYRLRDSSPVVLTLTKLCDELLEDVQGVTVSKLRAEGRSR